MFSSENGARNCRAAFESSANVLTSQSPPYDPAMGTYQLRGLLCRIERA